MIQLYIYICIHTHMHIYVHTAIYILLQYSGLENSLDYTVHGVTKSWTWLSDFHFHFLSYMYSKVIQFYIYTYTHTHTHSHTHIWGGHGSLLQYSCLENSMDRGAWWAIVHGVTKSWTRLKQLSTGAHAHTHTHTQKNIYILFQILFPFRLL